MCDTWAGLADATRDGHVILGKNSDRPIFDCQPLVRYERRRWPADSVLSLEHVAIPQAAETYATLGSSPYWCWGYEAGINEFGVTIGNEAIHTKPFRRASQAYPDDPSVQLGLLGMDLTRLGLERARTAAQAVGVIGELVEAYGQFGSGSPARSHAEGGYDGSFLIVDPEEAWVLETAGNHWVARRTDAGTVSISNQPSIRTRWDRGSEDIAEYAVEMGWWPAQDADEFDFARAYIDDGRPRHLSHLRAMRTGQLLETQTGDVTQGWMKRIARDHYEDTFLRGPYFDAADPDCLTVCMHNSPADFTWGNTASSCVAILPAQGFGLPVYWWTPGPPCNGCYAPFFIHGRTLPATVSTAGAQGKSVTAPSAWSQTRTRTTPTGGSSASCWTARKARPSAAGPASIRGATLSSASASTRWNAGSRRKCRRWWSKQWPRARTVQALQRKCWTPSARAVWSRRSPPCASYWVSLRDSPR